ncbi:hypothetical protein MRX96_009995 [Rhipicephalus microplus]
MTRDCRVTLSTEKKRQRLSSNSICFRFGRKDVLIDDRIHSLLTIEPSEKSSHVSRLEDLYENIQFCTTCLESFGMPSSEYVVLLQWVRMRSLSEDLAIQYRSRMKTETDASDSVV